MTPTPPEPPKPSMRRPRLSDRFTISILGAGLTVLVLVLASTLIYTNAKRWEWRAVAEGCCEVLMLSEQDECPAPQPGGLTL